MSIEKKFVSKIISKTMYGYISFVYKTSRINKIGFDEFNSKNREKVVFLFWHGDSFSLYPAFKKNPLYIITTKDRRGDFISETCHSFGYKTFRLPDNPDGGTYIHKIVDTMNNNDADMAIALDGPLGPNHEPKYFTIALSYLLKKNIVPVTIEVKNKIEIKKRWDNFKIPLPFTKINITFHSKITLTKADKKEKFKAVIEQIKNNK